MRALYLAWKRRDHRWWPVGRLSREGSDYVFTYTQGAGSAESAGFRPLSSFPDFDEVYVSTQLFPMFRNRLPPVTNSSNGSISSAGKRTLSSCSPEVADSARPTCSRSSRFQRRMLKAATGQLSSFTGCATEDRLLRRRFVASVRETRSRSKRSQRILTIRGRCESIQWFEASISGSCRAISARTCTRSWRRRANRRRPACSASTRLPRRRSFVCSAPWTRLGPRGFVRWPAPTSQHSTHSSPQGAPEDRQPANVARRLTPDCWPDATMESRAPAAPAAGTLRRDAILIGRLSAPAEQCGSTEPRSSA